MSKRVLQVCRRFNTKTYQTIIENGYSGLSQLNINSVDVSNQNMHTTSDVKLENIVAKFPATVCTIGYGSGVFQQMGYTNTNTKAPQIDLIHIVKDSYAFHKHNLVSHQDHYSGLRYFGLRAIEFFQNMGPVKMYFNPFVNINDSSVKYGIISESNALKDLIEWKNFYLAGRLQKPVKHIGSSPVLRSVNQYNLINAMSVALLLTDAAKITERELYETITSLSYMGDPRMRIGGENPNKVRNIVSKQLPNFCRLYSPIIDYFLENNYLSRNVNVSDVGEGVNEYSLNLTPSNKQALIQSLPLHFKHKLYEHEQDLYKLSRSSKLQKYIKLTLINVVSTPALVQSVKGIFTAGIYKSLQYMIEKRMKYSIK